MSGIEWTLAIAVGYISLIILSKYLKKRKRVNILKGKVFSAWQEFSEDFDGEPRREAIIEWANNFWAGRELADLPVEFDDKSMKYWLDKHVEKYNTV